MNDVQIEQLGTTLLAFMLGAIAMKMPDLLPYKGGKEASK